MELFKTLLALSEKTTKADYLLHVKNELKAVKKKLREAGYIIDREYRITIPKRVIYQSKEDVIYMNTLRFIYNGLKFDRWPRHPKETLLFIGLRGFVESQFENLPE